MWLLGPRPSRTFDADFRWPALACLSFNILRAAGVTASTRHAKTRCTTLRTHLVAVPVTAFEPACNAGTTRPNSIWHLSPSSIRSDTLRPLSRRERNLQARGSSHPQRCFRPQVTRGHKG